MATTKGREINPVLEKLRDDDPDPERPDINEVIKGLITIPKIHAAYLYYTQEGCVLLQKLCLELSGTKPTYRYTNWEDFGIKLGLEPILVKSIKHNLQSEDSTSYIFLAYVQQDDATIEQILFALNEIKRHDILLQIKDLVKITCNEILVKYNTDNKKDIIKPAVVPNCPFILKNLDKLQIKCTKVNLTTETLQKSTPFISQPKTNQNRYAKTILLTYASDADDIIKELLVHLRKPRCNLKLGIVILNEQRHILNINPEEFIFQCFTQIDYVFPVLTKQYIKQITKNSEDVNSSALENLDHKYVKFIYRLMNTHYLKNGCKNTKVRCLVPDDITKSVLKHPIMSHSLFQIWVRVEEINELIEAILKLKI